MHKKQDEMMLRLSCYISSFRNNVFVSYDPPFRRISYVACSQGVYGRERDRERRSADPRERVRKESEPSGGIVLSPQRRSFTSGCGAPAAAAPPPHVARTRPDSPLSAAAAAAAKADPGDCLHVTSSSFLD